MEDSQLVHMNANSQENDNSQTLDHHSKMNNFFSQIENQEESLKLPIIIDQSPDKIKERSIMMNVCDVDQQPSDSLNQQEQYDYLNLKMEDSMDQSSLRKLLKDTQRSEGRRNSDQRNSEALPTSNENFHMPYSKQDLESLPNVSPALNSHKSVDTQFVVNKHEDLVLKQAQDIIMRRSMKEARPSNTRGSKLFSPTQIQNKDLNSQIKDRINKGIITPINMKDIENLNTPGSNMHDMFTFNQKGNEETQQYNEYFPGPLDLQQYGSDDKSTINPDDQPNASFHLKHYMGQMKMLKIAPGEKGSSDKKDSESKNEQEIYTDTLSEDHGPQAQKPNSKKGRIENILFDDYTKDFRDIIKGNTSFYRRKHIKRCIIYPDQPFKARWDLFVTLLLMATCILTPYLLAFEQNQDNDIDLKWTIVDALINICFAIDIIVNFISAYEDNDFNMIDERKVSVIHQLLQVIVKSYLFGWFIIDILSVIPFDLILNSGSFNRLARVARIGKLYKIVKMTRMVRMLKIVKERNNLVKYLNEILKIGIGFERLMFLMLIFMVLQHIAACIWVFTGRFDDTTKMNWIYQSGMIDASDGQLYVSAFYFTVTCIVTVGFGDIHAFNVGEQCVCILLMLIGVVSFSFMTGSLSSIISNYDASQAKLKEKMAVLMEIKREYDINPELYDELRKMIKYDHSKISRDVIEFMEELPYKMKITLAMEIHKNIYHTIEFFKFKEKSFIAWVGPLLKPMKITEQEFIYKEGDEIREIFFLVKGVAGYVLPRFDNVVYIKIEEGDHFGHVDLVFDQEILKESTNMRRRTEKNNDLVRRFTVQAIINCELLMLLLDDIDKMKMEFPEVFEELFMNSYRRLKKEMLIKRDALKNCEQARQTKNLMSMRASNILMAMDKGRKSEIIQKYKDTNLKRTLTKSDIQNITKFSDNSLSLKQIDEELEEKSSSSDGELFEQDPANEQPEQTNEDEQSPNMNDEEQVFMDRFKKKFGKMFRSNYQSEKEENSEELQEMKARMSKLEDMFTRIMKNVEKISQDVQTIKDKN